MPSPYSQTPFPMVGTPRRVPDPGTPPLAPAPAPLSELDQLAALGLVIEDDAPDEATTVASQPSDLEQLAALGLVIPDEPGASVTGEAAPPPPAELMTDDAPTMDTLTDEWLRSEELLERQVAQTPLRSDEIALLRRLGVEDDGELAASFRIARAMESLTAPTPSTVFAAHAGNRVGLLLARFTRGLLGDKIPEAMGMGSGLAAIEEDIAAEGSTVDKGLGVAGQTVGVVASLIPFMRAARGFGHLARMGQWAKGATPYITSALGFASHTAATQLGDVTPGEMAEALASGVLFHQAGALKGAKGYLALGGIGHVMSKAHRGIIPDPRDPESVMEFLTPDEDSLIESGALMLLHGYGQASRAGAKKRLYEQYLQWTGHEKASRRMADTVYGLYEKANARGVDTNNPAEFVQFVRGESKARAAEEIKFSDKGDMKRATEARERKGATELFGGFVEGQAVSREVTRRLDALDKARDPDAAAREMRGLIDYWKLNERWIPDKAERGKMAAQVAGIEARLKARFGEIEKGATPAVEVPKKIKTTQGHPAPAPGSEPTSPGSPPAAPKPAAKPADYVDVQARPIQELSRADIELELKANEGGAAKEDTPRVLALRNRREDLLAEEEGAELQRLGAIQPRAEELWNNALEASGGDPEAARQRLIEDAKRLDAAGEISAGVERAQRRHTLNATKWAVRNLGKETPAEPQTPEIATPDTAPAKIVAPEPATPAPKTQGAAPPVEFSEDALSAAKARLLAAKNPNDAKAAEDDIERLEIARDIADQQAGPRPRAVSRSLQEMAARPAKPRIEGKDTTYFEQSTGRRIPARYAVMELNDVEVSHDPNDFAPNVENFPPEVQGRDYAKNKGDQEKVLGIGNALAPEALLSDTPAAEGAPPGVTPQGFTIIGNARTMGMKRAAAQNKAGWQAYQKTLREKAAQFGLDPAKIEGMKQPVLVRVLDIPAGEWVDTARNSDISGTGRKSSTDKAIDWARNLPPEIMDEINLREEKGQTETFSKVLTDKSRAPKIMRALIQAGVIPTIERNEYVTDDGMPTETARTLIPRAILATAFDGDFVRRVEGYPALQNRLINMAPELLRAKALGEGLKIAPANDIVAVMEDAARRLMDRGVAGISGVGKSAWMESLELLGSGMYDELPPPAAMTAMRFLIELRAPAQRTALNQWNENVLGPWTRAMKSERGGVALFGAEAMRVPPIQDVIGWVREKHLPEEKKRVERANQNPMTDEEREERLGKAAAAKAQSGGMFGVSGQARTAAAPIRSETADSGIRPIEPTAQAPAAEGSGSQALERPDQVDQISLPSGVETRRTIIPSQSKYSEARATFPTLPEAWWGRIEDMINRALGNVADLAAALNTIRQENGIEVPAVVDVKQPGSMARKALKRINSGQAERGFSDVLRATVYFTDPAQIPGLLASTTAALQNAKVDNEWNQPMPSGYRRVHVDGTLASGQAVEIQFQPAGFDETKEKGHKIYDQLQKAMAEGTLTEKQAEEHFKTLRAIYEPWYEVFEQGRAGEPFGKTEELEPMTRERFERELGEVWGHDAKDAQAIMPIMDGIAAWEERAGGHEPGTFWARRLGGTFGEAELRALDPALSEESLKQIAAMHVSMADFEWFDTAFMGTGEGVQAFGWGLYFTNSQAVKEHYKRVFKSKQGEHDSGIIIDGIDQNHPVTGILYSIASEWNDEGVSYDANKLIDFTITELKRLRQIEWAESNEKARNESPIWKYYKDSIEYLSQLDPSNVKVKVKNFGVVYGVAIHKGKEPKEYDYLGWRQGPSAAQIEKIRRQAEKEQKPAADDLTTAETKPIRANTFEPGAWIKHTSWNKEDIFTYKPTDRPLKYQIQTSKGDGSNWDYRIYYEKMPGVWGELGLAKTMERAKIEVQNHYNNTKLLETITEYDELNKTYEVDGAMVYDALEDALGSPREASLFLLRAGIDGIQYEADQGRQGEAWNYVVFDPAAITIEEKVLFQKTNDEGRTSKGEQTRDKLSPRQMENVVEKRLKKMGIKRVSSYKVIPEGAPGVFYSKEMAGTGTVYFKFWTHDDYLGTIRLADHGPGGIRAEKRNDPGSADTGYEEDSYGSFTIDVNPVTGVTWRRGVDLLEGKIKTPPESVRGESGEGLAGASLIESSKASVKGLGATGEPGTTPALKAGGDVSKRRVSAKGEGSVAQGGAASQAGKLGEMLFQELQRVEAQSGARGAMRWDEAGRAILYALKNKDRTTVIHEIGHVLRRVVTETDPEMGRMFWDEARRETQTKGRTKAEREEAKGAADGRWTRGMEETFAEWWEKYLSSGRSPVKALAAAFARLKELFREVWRRLKGTAAERTVPEAAREAFDRILTPVPSPEALRSATPGKALEYGSETYKLGRFIGRDGEATDRAFAVAAEIELPRRPNELQGRREAVPLPDLRLDYVARQWRKDNAIMLADEATVRGIVEAEATGQKRPGRKSLDQVKDWDGVRVGVVTQMEARAVAKASGGKAVIVEVHTGAVGKIQTNDEHRTSKAEQTKGTDGGPVVLFQAGPVETAAKATGKALKKMAQWSEIPDAVKPLVIRDLPGGAKDYIKYYAGTLPERLEAGGADPAVYDALWRLRSGDSAMKAAIVEDLDRRFRPLEKEMRHTSWKIDTKPDGAETVTYGPFNPIGAATRAAEMRRRLTRALDVIREEDVDFENKRLRDTGAGLRRHGILFDNMASPQLQPGDVIWYFGPERGFSILRHGEDIASTRRIDQAQIDAWIEQIKDPASDADPTGFVALVSGEAPRDLIERWTAGKPALAWQLNEIVPREDVEAAWNALSPEARKLFFSAFDPAEKTMRTVFDQEIPAFSQATQREQFDITPGEDKVSHVPNRPAEPRTAMGRMAQTIYNFTPFPYKYQSGFLEPEKLEQDYYKLSQSARWALGIDTLMNESATTIMATSIKPWRKGEDLLPGFVEFGRGAIKETTRIVQMMRADWKKFADAGLDVNELIKVITGDVTHGYWQIPKVDYDEVMRLRDDPSQSGLTSPAARAVEQAMNDWFNEAHYMVHTGLLTRLSTTVRNTTSGAAQFAAKAWVDFYRTMGEGVALALARGDGREMQRDEALRAMDELLGDIWGLFGGGFVSLKGIPGASQMFEKQLTKSALKSVEQRGRIMGAIQGAIDTAMIPFNAVERHFKRAAFTSAMGAHARAAFREAVRQGKAVEADRAAFMREFMIQTPRDFIRWKGEAVKFARGEGDNAALDAWQKTGWYTFHYGERPAITRAVKESKVGRLALPFPDYQYFKWRLYGYLLGPQNWQALLPDNMIKALGGKPMSMKERRERWARLMAGITMFGAAMLFLMLRKREDAVGKSLQTEKFGYEYDTTGRIRVGTNADGEEYWLRLMDQPFIGEALGVMAMAEGGIGLSDYLQESVTLGPAAKMGALGLGFKTKYELHRDIPSLMGKQAQVAIPLQPWIYYAATSGFFGVAGDDPYVRKWWDSTGHPIGDMWGGFSEGLPGINRLLPAREDPATGELMERDPMLEALKFWVLNVKKTPADRMWIQQMDKELGEFQEWQRDEKRAFERESNRLKQKAADDARAAKKNKVPAPAGEAPPSKKSMDQLMREARERRARR